MVSYYCLVWEASSLAVLCNYQNMQYVNHCLFSLSATRATAQWTNFFCIVHHTSEHLCVDVEIFMYSCTFIATTILLHHPYILCHFAKHAHTTEMRQRQQAAKKYHSVSLQMFIGYYTCNVTVVSYCMLFHIYADV